MTRLFKTSTNFVVNSLWDNFSFFFFFTVYNQKKQTAHCVLPETPHDRGLGSESQSLKNIFAIETICKHKNSFSAETLSNLELTQFGPFINHSLIFICTWLPYISSTSLTQVDWPVKLSWRERH